MNCSAPFPDPSDYEDIHDPERDPVWLAVSLVAVWALVVFVALVIWAGGAS